MSILIADINMFAGSINLFEVKDDEKKFQENIPFVYIVDLGKREDIDELYLTGAPRNYLEGLSKQIQSKTINNYNNNHMKIKILEKE